MSWVIVSHYLHDYQAKTLRAYDMYCLRNSETSIAQKIFKYSGAMIYRKLQTMVGNYCSFASNNDRENKRLQNRDFDESLPRKNRTVHANKSFCLDMPKCLVQIK